MNNSINFTYLTSFLVRVLAISFMFLMLMLTRALPAAASIDATANVSNPPKVEVSVDVDGTQDFADSIAASIDDIAGQGTSKQVEGTIDRAAGKAKQELGKATGQAEGVAQQVKGKAKQDIGTVENKTEQLIDDSTNALEDAGNSVGDRVKNFLSLFN